jgi:O-antigen ligase
MASLSVVCLIFLAALYFSQTRSWVYGAAAGVVVMSFVMGGRRSTELLIAMLIFGGGFWFWSERTGNRYTKGPESDDSAATRPVLWSAGFNIALDNPVFGVGHNAFLTLSPEYAERIDDKYLETFDAGGALGTYTPHNDPLNIWLSFGTPALIAYLAITWYACTNFVFAYKRLKDPLLRAIAIGSLGSLVAFTINSVFHNFFDSTLHFWILAGLSIALCTLAARDEEQAEREATWRAS